MKNIRNLSVFIIILQILLVLAYYFVENIQYKSFINFYLPLILLITAFILFVFVFVLNKKIKAIKEELLLHKQQELSHNELVQNDSEHKAENVINYTSIVERVTSKLQTDSKNHYFETLLSNLSKELNGVQAVSFLFNRKNELFELVGKYAYYSERLIEPIKFGIGISGQVAKDRKMLILSNVPENYVEVVSGLGNSSPKYLLIYPIVIDNQTVGLVEIATFEAFNKGVEVIFNKIFDKLTPEIQNFL
jgi:putative methionine-R-sulfoxide reductase with GAF domain